MPKINLTFFITNQVLNIFSLGYFFEKCSIPPPQMARKTVLGGLGDHYFSLVSEIVVLSKFSGNLLIFLCVNRYKRMENCENQRFPGQRWLRPFERLGPTYAAYLCVRRFHLQHSDYRSNER